MRHTFAVLASLLVLLAAPLAQACPVCAQRAESGGPMRYIALGCLVFMPWALAIIAGLYIRRGLRQAEETAE
jgi:hypothetical protein